VHKQRKLLGHVTPFPRTRPLKWNEKWRAVHNSNFEIHGCNQRQTFFFGSNVPNI